MAVEARTDVVAAREEFVDKPVKGRSLWQDAGRRFIRNKAAVFFLGLLALIVPQFRSSVDRLLARLGISEMNGWDFVLLLFAAMYLAAALCWMRLRITGPGGNSDDVEDMLTSQAGAQGYPDLSGPTHRSGARW